MHISNSTKPIAIKTAPKSSPTKKSQFRKLDTPVEEFKPTRLSEKKSESPLSLKERKEVFAQRATSTLRAFTKSSIAVGAVALAGHVAASLSGIGTVMAGIAGSVMSLLPEAFTQGAESVKKGFEAGVELANKKTRQAGQWIGKTLSNYIPATNVKEWETQLTPGTQKYSDEDWQKFESSLKPGDIVLGYSEENLFFQLLTKACGKPLSTHAMIYEGDGKIIDATDPGVKRVDLAERRSNYGYWFAVRPDYDSKESIDKTLAKAESLIGKKYDWYASLHNDRYGCSELPYVALKEGAPEVEVPVTRYFGVRDYVAPQDYLEVPGAKVVAELGTFRDFQQTFRAQSIKE